MIENHFYNKDIRKAVVTFGALFNNITLIKTDNSGTEIKRSKVPLGYGSKEHYIARLQQDPENKRPMGLVLPRMAFELVNFRYDSKRKQQTMQKFSAVNPLSSSSLYKNFVPVPYDLEFNLHIISREIDDGLQIIEQILPWFTPDYTPTIKFNDVFGKETAKDTPIILNGINHEDSTEGNIDQVRLLVWTISFTMKSYLYGPSKTQGQILHITVNYYDATTDKKVISINGQSLLANTTRRANTIIMSANAMSVISTNDIIQIQSDIVKVLNINSSVITTNHEFTYSLSDQHVTKLIGSNNKLVMYTADVQPNTALITDNYTVDEVFTEYT